MADTRHALLRSLLHHKEEGLTIDELGERLAISRNAVQQHLVGLERDGLVTTHGRRSTGGRPSRTYVLSEQGYETFPRNYALLAQQMLASARDTLGDEAVEALLMRMADELTDELTPRLAQLEGDERLAEVVRIMNELGYDATAHPRQHKISAVNCVYHKLAKQTRAICRYDVRLLSLLTGDGIEHTACMADGDSSCVFELEGRQPGAPRQEGTRR